MATSDSGAGDDRNGGEANPVLRSLRATTGRESTTFGFSILVTVTFALVQTSEGAPGVVEIFLYAVGAVLSFTLLTGLLTRGFRGSMPQHHTATLALGTSLNVVSVVLALGAGLLVTALLGGTAVWAVAPFVATTVYLLTESAEEALAERILVARGQPQAEDVEA